MFSVVSQKERVESSAQVQPQSELRREPTVADMWPKFAPLTFFGNTSIPRRLLPPGIEESQAHFLSGAEITQTKSVRWHNRITQKIHDIRQFMRFISTLEPPEISKPELDRWQDIVKHLSGLNIKFIHKDEPTPLFKYIRPDQNSSQTTCYELSTAILGGDHLPTRNKNLALVLSWVVADSLYYQLNENRLSTALLKLSEKTLPKLLRPFIKSQDASSQELMTGILAAPIYTFFFRWKTKNLTMVPESKMEEIKAEFSKNHGGQKLAQLISAAETIVRSIDDKKPHEWGPSTYAIAKRFALGAAKIGASESAIAAALFSPFEKSKVKAEIDRIAPGKLRNRLEDAYNLLDAFGKLDQPFQMLPSAVPERPSAFLCGLQNTFLQRLRIYSQGSEPNNSTSSFTAEDLYKLYVSILIEKAGFITPARKPKEIERLCNQILLRDAPLAERLGHEQLFEALITTAVRTKFPLEFQMGQVALRNATGMHFKERMTWHEQEKHKLRETLIALGLNPGVKATADTPEIPPGFEVQGGPKRLYSAILKLFDSLIKHSDPKDAENSLLRDLFRLRVIINKSSALNGHGDRVFSPAEIVDILQATLPEQIGKPIEGKKVKHVYHRNETIHYNKLCCPHPFYPERKLNFELQIMTGKFYSEVYQRGLNSVSGLAHSSAPHWLLKAGRNLRIILSELRKKLEYSVFANKQLPEREVVSNAAALNKKLDSLSKRLDGKICIDVGATGYTQAEFLREHNLRNGFPCMAKTYPLGAVAFDVLLDPDLGVSFSEHCLFKIKRKNDNYSLLEMKLTDRIEKGESYVIAKRALPLELSDNMAEALREQAVSLRAKIWLYPIGQDGAASILANGKEKITNLLNLKPENHLNDILQFFGLGSEHELYQGVGQLLINNAALEKWLKRSFVSINARAEKKDSSLYIELDEVGRGALRDILSVCELVGIYPKDISVSQSPTRLHESLRLNFPEEEAKRLPGLADNIQRIRRERGEEPPVRFGYTRKIAGFIEKDGLLELVSTLADMRINIESISMREAVEHENRKIIWIELDVAGPDAFINADETQLHELTREHLETALRGLKIAVKKSADHAQSIKVPVFHDLEIIQTTEQTI